MSRKTFLHLASVSEAANAALQDLQRQEVNTGLNVIGQAADILFPLAALKMFGFERLSDGVLGLAGCVSSAVGLRKAWKATA